MTSSRGDGDVKKKIYKNKMIVQTIISQTCGPKLL